MKTNTAATNPFHFVNAECHAHVEAKPARSPERISYDAAQALADFANTGRPEVEFAAWLTEEGN